MDTTASTALGFLVLGIPLLILLAMPVFRKSRPGTTDGGVSEIAELLTERERSYTALADLDFEYECGKLSEDDYRQLRAALVQETAAILAQVDARIAQTQERRGSKKRRVPQPAPKPVSGPPVAEDAIEREIARFKAARERSQGARS